MQKWEKVGGPYSETFATGDRKMHRKPARKCRLKRSQIRTQKVDEGAKRLKEKKREEDFAGVEWEGKAGEELSWFII